MPEAVTTRRPGHILATPESGDRVSTANGCQRCAAHGTIGIMGRSSTLNVSLTPHQRQFVDARVTSGGYESASEVIRESLRLLEEQEKTRAAYWADVRAKVKEGREAIARGDYADGEAFVATLDANLARKAQRQPRHRK